MLEYESKGRCRAMILSIAVGIGAAGSALAQTSEENDELPGFEEITAIYDSGQYEEAIAHALAGVEQAMYKGSWEAVIARSSMATGDYEAAYARLSEYAKGRPYDLRPRLLLREAALHTGRETEALLQLEEISFLVNRGSRRYYYNPDDAVALGEAALLLGIEPRIILDNIFKPVQADEEAPASAFIAAGTLALEKSDFALASKTLQEGLKKHPDNPDLWFGLARSFLDGDRSKLIEYASKALEANSRHVPSLLLLAEHLIDAEAYGKASEKIEEALSTNPKDPNALALKAALAYIGSDTVQGDLLREQALSTWKSNPNVDYAIGRKLSRKYWFEEAAAFQRSALALDPDFLPAKTQLAQDLLRLAKHDEGWALADEAHEQDPYNIEAFNLVTLKDKHDGFASIESENFRIIMSAEEAPVYGKRALALLENAHATLSERYGIELPNATTVEIYANPADFETRTFGMPGTSGFLGVCFGPVFTVNSPVTRQANWEAVLYHEFCHTITLALTRNRMPRWLSEGISVFEEQRANPSWGQTMQATYRQRILDEEMLPISEMSSAFLKAQDSEAIRFAYFQSALIVEFLHDRYGIEAIRSLLQSLAKGVDTNSAIAQHLAPVETLDKAFFAFAKEKAQRLAPGYEFDSDHGMIGAALNALNPKPNYSKELRLCHEHIRLEEWDEGIAALEELIDQAGYVPGPENAHALLADAYRETDQHEHESKALETIANIEGDRLDPVTRLLELAETVEDQEDIFRWSNAWLAINPMADTPWRALMESSIALQRQDQAIQAGEALVALKPPDIAAIHYTLAKQYMEIDTAKAKRHTLLALENAPRFRQAYELLASLKRTETEARQSHYDKYRTDQLDTISETERALP